MRNEVQADMPCGLWSDLDAKRERAITVRRSRRGILYSQRQTAMDASGPFVALAVIIVLGVIIEGELPCAVTIGPPFTLDLAPLQTLAPRLGWVGEIRVYFNLKS